MRNPKVLEKVRAEIKQVEVLDFDTVRKYMPYLEAVMYETLRMHPVIPTVVRFATEDTVILAGKCAIPVKRGDTIYVAGNSLNRNDNVWSEPHTFKPERFLTPLGRCQEGRVHSNILCSMEANESVWERGLQLSKSRHALHESFNATIFIWQMKTRF